MKRRLPWLTVMLMLATFLANTVSAQKFVISELVATDTTTGTIGDAINALEFYDNGLYWTIPTLSGGVEFSHAGGLGLMAQRDTPFSTPYAVVNSGLPRALAFATRDDTFVYYTGGDGVHRKPVDARPADPALLIGGGWNVDEPGALMLYQGRVYYAYGNTTPMNDPASSHLQLAIEYFPAPGAGPQETPVRVAMGTTLPSDPGAIIKMGVVFRQESGVSSLVPFGVGLTANGFLLGFNVEAFNIPFLMETRVLATDVTDFVIRREHVPVEQDTLYVTVGRSVCAGGSRGTIEQVDPLNGNVTTFWTAPDAVRLTAIGADQDYLFISSFPVTPSGGPFGGCSTIGTGVIRAKYQPAGVSARPPDANWSDIELTAGENLRSDGQYLYFTYQQQIRRMPNNSPRLVLDLAAVGLEAVQAVQDLNNSVPLVVGKPVLVRGYANVVQNNTGLANLSAGAVLHAFRGGIELPGSPISSENSPALTAAGDLASLRTNLQRSFQFHAPASWLVPGTLTLTLNVNPNLSAPESLDLLGNNSVSANLTVVPARRPTLVFKPMSSTHPNYDPGAAGSGFWDIIERAKTLLPVDDFNIFFADGSVTKPVATIFGVRGRSFDLPDDKTWALIWMTVDHLFSSSPDGNPDTHWIGMFPGDDSPKFNGIGGAPGVKLSDLMDNPPIDLSIPDTALDSTLVVRMSAQRGNAPGNPWSTIVGGHTLAHELGHNYGRFHIRQASSCGNQDPLRPWQRYPADPCTLGTIDVNNPAAPIGYDPLSGSLILPSQAGDLMSYADSDWVSPFTWNALVAAIPSGNAPQSFVAGGRHGGFATTKINPQPLPPHDPIFVWEGIIRADNNAGLLLNGFRLPRGTLDPALVQSSLDASAAMPRQAPYHLRLIGDPNAVPLDDRPVTLMGPGDGNASEMIFVQAVPDLGSATRVQLMNGATVLSEIVASPNAPAITLGQPAVDTNAQTLSLTWTAADPDGDPLLFSAQFSADGGTNWQALLVNQPDTGLALSTRHLAGSTNCVVRVIASDGFNTALATTDPFVIPTHAPEIVFTGVVDGQQIALGNVPTVTASAYDAEDGSLPSARLQWSIAGPTLLTGSGATIPLAGLTPGNYTVTGQASDSDGNPGTAIITLEILPLTVPDATAPTVDGYGSDLGYAAAQVVGFSPQTAQPGARLIHANGQLFASFEGLPQSAAGTTEANLLIAFDPTEGGNATPQVGDIAISLDENGLAYQYRGDGTSLAADTLAPGVHAVITRRGGFWNAELALPESLLGGWNHRGRVALRLQWVPSGGVPGPAQTNLWPSAADLANPTTWAPALFGTAPSTSTNRPPVAVASGPVIVALDDAATIGLSGAGSFDPDGNPLTFSWSQIAGPPVVLQGGDGSAPAFTVPLPNSPVTLGFQLIVNDGLVDSAPVQVSVQLVPETAPSLAGGMLGITTDPADGSASVQLTWPGPAGSPVVIQASTNLIDWTDLATSLVGPLQTIALRDAAAGQFPQRFYRALSAQSTQAPAAGNALQFIGTDSLVTIPDDPALDALPLTVMAWINTTQSAGAYPAMIAKYQGGQAHGYALALDTGRFTPWYYVDGNNHVEELTGGQLDGLFVADGRWHHLAYVVGSTNAQIYIDGTLMNELPWVGTAGPATTTEPLLFGRYNGGSGQAFAGQLDEVSIWNRALTETEVRSHMHHLLQGTESGLLGNWRFDEADGATVSDSSGQGHDGAVSGAVDRVNSTAPIYP
jgi:hypothetical protein